MGAKRPSWKTNLLHSGKWPRITPYYNRLPACMLVAIKYRPLHNDVMRDIGIYGSHQGPGGWFRLGTGKLEYIKRFEHVWILRY